MAVRPRPGYVNERTREKIKTTVLLNRLQSYANGEIELSQGQVKAIDILLKKTLPDLTDVRMEVDAKPVIFSFDLNGEVDRSRFKHNDPLLKDEEDTQGGDE